MPAELYEIVALAARFWFLFLMVLIVWRSYRWYARERRQYKKRLRYLPDAGYIGELVVMQTTGGVKQGKTFSVPFEGTLGYTGSNDLSIPAPGVSNRHIWFSYDKKKGLKLIPLGRNDFAVDHLTIAQQPKGLYMAHGSRLYVGECELRLRMFAGYEVLTAHNPVSLPGQAGDERRYGQLLPDPQEPPQGRPVWQQPAAPAPYSNPAPAAPYGQPYGAAPQGYGYPRQPAAPAPAPYGGYARPQAPYDPYGGMQQPPVQHAYQQPVQPVPAYQSPQAFAPQVQQSAAQPRPAEYSTVAQEDNRPNPYARPVTLAAEPEFHPLVDDEGWDDFDADGEEDYSDYDGYDDYGHAGAEEPRGGYEPVREQTSAPAQATLRQPSARPAAPQPAPQEFYPLEQEEDESWPYLTRPDEWRSEGLFDDLLDEDGTDAAAPAGRAYRGGGSL